MEGGGGGGKEEEEEEEKKAAAKQHKKKISGKQNSAGEYSLNEYVMPGIYDREGLCCWGAVCGAAIAYARLGQYFFSLPQNGWERPGMDVNTWQRHHFT